MASISSSQNGGFASKEPLIGKKSRHGLEEKGKDPCQRGQNSNFHVLKSIHFLRKGSHTLRKPEPPDWGHIRPMVTRSDS